MTEVGGQVDLWGAEHTPYVKLVERYGVWPTTVWDCQHSDPATRELKALIGDAGEERPNALAEPNLDGTAGRSTYRGKTTTSIFNPAVAAWALNMFAPEPPSVVFDPFAGGGTRAVVSVAKGHGYLGVELRDGETRAVQERLSRAQLEAEVVTADARSVPFGAAVADFLLTCPPYWNLEEYHGGERDLSMAATYEEFLDGLGEVVRESHRVLKPGSLSVWVSGLLRDRDGELLSIPHALATLHAQTAFSFREEVILNQRGNGAIQRVGNFERGDRRLVRVHEYLSVFRKKVEA